MRCERWRDREADAVEGRTRPRIAQARAHTLAHDAAVPLR